MQRIYLRDCEMTKKGSDPPLPPQNTVPGLLQLNPLPRGTGQDTKLLTVSVR